MDAQFTVLFSQTALRQLQSGCLGETTAAGWTILFLHQMLLSGGRQGIQPSHRESETKPDRCETRPVPFVVTASSADGVTAVATAQGRLVQKRASPGTLLLQPDEQRDLRRLSSPCDF